MYEHQNESQKVEYFDSEEIFEEKITILADLVKKSQHFLAFTGAGISTSCGIPDFRSGVNTVLKTGPGAWEKRAMGIKEVKGNHIISMEKAIPSFTHMALVTLEKSNHLKFLVSQNTDGLHMRSGFDPSKLSELHGNRNLERCKNCGNKYLRDFRTREAAKVLDHRTSRKCLKCKRWLQDSIINFGECLDDDIIDKAFEKAEMSDLCLCMGSSLTCNTAPKIPRMIGEQGKLVIVNLQKTALDDVAFLRINALCDQVMGGLIQKLKLPIQKFRLQRFIQFKIKKEELTFRSINRVGTPYTFLKSVTLIDKNKEEIKLQEPFKFNLDLLPAVMRLEFYGHLGEPVKQIEISEPKQGCLLLEFDPADEKWEKKWIHRQTLEAIL